MKSSRESRLVAVLALVIGVLIGLGLKAFFAINIEAKISLGDLLEAAAALALGGLLYLAADQLTDRHKFLLSLLQNDLERLQERLHEIDQFFERAASTTRTASQSQRMLAAFKEASMAASALKSKIDMFGFGAQSKDACRALQESLGSYRTSGTDEGFKITNYMVPIGKLAHLRKCSTATHEALTALARALLDD